MKFWLKNIKTGEIVCGFKIPKGYSARTTANNWILENGFKLTDFKIVYKNPF